MVFTVKGYCQGYNPGTLNPSCKFVVVDDAVKPLAEEPDQQADEEAADEADMDLEVEVKKKAKRPGSEKQVTSAIKYVGIRRTAVLPSYSPFLLYTLELELPKESIYPIRRILRLERRFPLGEEGPGVPKSVISTYWADVLLRPKAQKKLAGLKPLIRKQADIQYCEKISQGTKDDLMDFMALHFASDTFLALLRWFPCTFLVEFEEEELAILHQFLVSRHRWIFCFPALCQRILANIESPSRPRVILFPASKASRLEVQAQHQWTASSLPPPPFHPHFPLWSTDTYVTCSLALAPPPPPPSAQEAEAGAEAEEEGPTAELLDQALKVLVTCNKARDLYGHSVHATVGFLPQAVEFLDKWGIMVHPHRYVDAANADSAFDEMCQTICHPEDMQFEYAVTEFFKRIDAVHLVSTGLWGEELGRYLSELSFKLGAKTRIFSDNDATAAHLAHLTGLPVMGTVPYEHSQRLTFEKRQKKRKKAEEDELWTGIQSIVFVRANKISARAYWQTLQKMMPELPPIGQVRSQDAMAKFLSGLITLPTVPLAAHWPMIIYLIGDTKEHLNSARERSGFSSALFSNLRVFASGRDNMLVEDDQVAASSSSSAAAPRERTIYSNVVEHKTGSLKITPVKDVQQALKNIKEWSKPGKSSKKPRLTYQIFASDWKVCRQFEEERRSKTEVNYDSRAFNIGDKVIVSNELGLTGSIRKAWRKVVADPSGVVEWRPLGIKESIKTHLEEYKLIIDRQDGNPSVIIYTQDHVNTLKHGHAILPRDHPGFTMDYAFVYVNNRTSLIDLASVLKYARKDVYFLLDPHVTFDHIHGVPRTLPRSLTSFLV